MTVISKPLAAAALATLLLCAGCSNPVTYTISEQYAVNAPAGVAVLPVDWPASWSGFSGEEDKAVSYLLRTMVHDKLVAKNYRPVPLEVIDEAYLKAGKAAFSGRQPKELAALFNADAVLVVKMTGWDKAAIAGYASLTIDASFDMYSGAGAPLWTAQHSTKETDLGSDSMSAEYSVIKAYEPRVQRFVDAVFSTLPDAPARQRQGGFFQWLP